MEGELADRPLSREQPVDHEHDVGPKVVEDSRGAVLHPGHGHLVVGGGGRAIRYCGHGRRVEEPRNTDRRGVRRVHHAAQAIGALRRPARIAAPRKSVAQAVGGKARHLDEPIREPGAAVACPWPGAALPAHLAGGLAAAAGDEGHLGAAQPQRLGDRQLIGGVVRERAQRQHEHARARPERTSLAWHRG